MDFFATAAPCNPLGRFVLTHSAQNDKIRRHRKVAANRPQALLNLGLAGIVGKCLECLSY